MILVLSKLNFSSLALAVTLLALGAPHGAFGSSRGVVSAISSAPQTTDGLCALSVTVQGYKCQEFEVRTKDGYILSVQRIPEGRGGGSGGGAAKQPVLLQHGVLVDGMSWVVNSPSESLAFVLADNGFDVWIANARGTRFSSKHSSLDPTRPEYWNWSWDELAAYDLPATVDFVHGQTGQKLHYVGHSMGTLVALASFSQNKVVDKLRSAALLSPVAYLSHMATLLGMLAAKAFVGEMTTLAGIAEFNPKGRDVAEFLKALCSDPAVDCYDLITAITGKNCCLNASTVGFFLKNEPQPTATKNMVHLAQTVRDGVLSKYDYGTPHFNMAHYGQPRPPVYNLTAIPNDFPIFLSYGGQDALADPHDVGTLLDDLKLHNLDKLTVQFVKDFAHADFIMGITAKDIVYNAMLAFFKRQ
ncbi:hypothetical protein Scep_018156 [Stephania cephalantha]|uniref:Lipase n=1 Tax=Stephania cephalantha TaxID=152367 RepID=A0AAP0IS90_9MAGN